MSATCFSDTFPKCSLKGPAEAHKMHKILPLLLKNISEFILGVSCFKNRFLNPFLLNSNDLT